MDVRALLVRAQGTSGAERAATTDLASALLRRTEAMTLPGGASVAVSDRDLADRIAQTDESLASAVALVDLELDLAARAASPVVDGAAADAKLREILSQSDVGASSPSLLAVLQRAVTRFLAGLEGPRVDLTILWPVIGGLGVAVILFVLATLGRALPERIRSEVVVRESASDERLDPARHLRAADEALAGGRARDAVHALYLFALTSLASREAIRYDPALTDRELLSRAASIPNADSLRDLVSVYERSWFGLRDVAPDEARRARALALRVAG